MIAPNPPSADLVSPDFACPHCGERDIDRLVWIDDEQVACQSCGAIYKPGGDSASQ